MGLVFSQAANGQVIAIPQGTTVGRVHITKHDVVLEGTGPDCVLQTDGVAGALIGGTGSVVNGVFVPGTPDGQPVSKVTIRRCTLDGLDLEALTVLVNSNDSAGPRIIELDDVRAIGYRGTAFQTFKGEIIGRTLSGQGPGTFMKVLGDGAQARVRHVSVLGGRGGFITDTATHGAITLDDWLVRMGWWQTPTAEPVTVQAHLTDRVVVAAHDQAVRSATDCLRALVPCGTWPGVALNRWRRLEAADGRWAHVRRPGQLEGWFKAGSWSPAAAPETAQAYDIALSRVHFWSATELYNHRWRNPAGRSVERPPLSATYQILRSYTGVLRDVDSGAFHLQDNTHGAVLRRCRQEASFSDGFSVRGDDCLIEDCESSHSQDMDATNGGNAGRGRNVWRRCEFRSGGWGGLYVCDGEGPTIERCRFVSIGTHGTGLGHGVIDDSGIAVVRDCLFVGNLAGNVRLPG